MFDGPSNAMEIDGTKSTMNLLSSLSMQSGVGSWANIGFASVGQKNKEAMQSRQKRSWTRSTLTKNNGKQSENKDKSESLDKKQTTSGSGGSVNYEALKEEFIEEMRYLSRLRHPCITTVMGEYQNCFSAQQHFF